MGVNRTTHLVEQLFTHSKKEVSISLDQRSQKIILRLKTVEQEYQKWKNNGYSNDSIGQTPDCGIALSIVDRVVQLHNDKLKLLNTSNGTGLKVVIELN